MSETLVLPAHEPCGPGAIGELVGGSSTRARCLEIRTFERCGCRPDPKNPDRGTQACPRCHGCGYWVKSRRPGCGALSLVCPHCGVRARWNDGPCLACEPKEVSNG